MKLYCIENKFVADELTINKEYEIEDSFDLVHGVTNDKGNYETYGKIRFSEKPIN